MVSLGVKVDLPVFNAAEIILVHPGRILTLFLVTIGMEFALCKVCSLQNLAMQTSVPKMFCLSKRHSESQTQTLIWMV